VIPTIFGGVILLELTRVKVFPCLFVDIMMFWGPYVARE